MNTPFALATTVVLLAGNAFFVGAEFAVTSSRRSQLEPLAGAGDARAATALWALEHISHGRSPVRRPRPGPSSTR